MTPQSTIRTNPGTTPWGTQRGVTLVELMISLLIGSIVLLGVVSLFIGSSQTQRVQQHLNYISEDIRFLSEFLSYDVRMAGYTGECDEDNQDWEELDEDPIQWNSNTLTLYYCDDDEEEVVKVEYEFDNSSARVNHNGEPLVEGVRTVSGYPRFGNSDGTRLTHSEDHEHPVRSIEFLFEFTGPDDDPPGDFGGEREVGFVVAVRNRTLERLNPDADDDDDDDD